MLTRLLNVFRRRQLEAEIDEELRAHLEEAVEHGRDPEEARRALGSMLRLREESQDAQLAVWLDSLRADAVFALRQLRKHRAATLATVLSLALTIGATTAAFRLLDAVLWRPLPIATPERLHVLSYPYLDQNGEHHTGMSFDYPAFRQLRDAVKGDATLMAVSGVDAIDITHGQAEPEKVWRQYVSGEMFRAFGLRPAVGRLLGPQDDRQPGGHPVAVLSHDYWTRRFGQDRGVVGRAFRHGHHLYEVVGVASAGFHGTETGHAADLFVPTMMNVQSVEKPNWGWVGVLAMVEPGASPDAVRQKLAAVFQRQRLEKVKGWQSTSPRLINDFVNVPLRLEPAPNGASGFQLQYRQPLLIIGALALIALLIACANAANLMLAQGAARAREMALRVSIGAGRGRLIRLVLVECALLALAATLLGGMATWWAAPFIASMVNPPDDPVRLALPFDFRVFAFAAVVASGVALVFGLVPALRASGVQPMFALRGGDPQARRRLMHGLVAAQVAFCFVVHAAAGLFVASLQRLSQQPLGFVAGQVMVAEAAAPGNRDASLWLQAAARVREGGPGVDSVAVCSWPLLSTNAWVGGVRVPGTTEWDPQPPYFLAVSPGWFETMGIPLTSGRDFRPGEGEAEVAVVTQAFVRRYFPNTDPVGRAFEWGADGQARAAKVRIVGLVPDLRYRDLRETPRAVVFVPFAGDRQRWASLVIKTRQSAGLADWLRQSVPRIHPELRLSSVGTQQEFVDQHTLRERLLALLAVFFALVSVLLAGLGLYGVLDYSVLARRREFGIRIALGAPPAAVARRVTAEIGVMLLVGAAAGVALGAGAERFVRSLLFEARLTDPVLAALPWVTLSGTAVLAALPPVLRALRVDPARVLRID